MHPFRDIRKMILAALAAGLILVGCAAPGQLPQATPPASRGSGDTTPPGPGANGPATGAPATGGPGTDDPAGSPTAAAPGGGVLQSNLARQAPPASAAADLPALAEGNRDFALDFYQAVRGREGNLFYSPYSLSLALAMTYAGARGETADQMAATLHFDLPQDRLHPAFNALDQELAARSAPAAVPTPTPLPGQAAEAVRFRLNVANSLWGQAGYPFLPDFLDQLAENYGAGLRLTDYVADPEGSRQAINEWVSRQTEERIQDLIPEGAIDSLTRLVLANAIYFDAAWANPFEKDLTRDGPFYRRDGSQVTVPLMALSDPALLAHTQGEGYQAVELPYVGGQVAMTLLVPDQGTFDAFEAGLDGARLEAILAGLEPRTVSLTMPKYRFEAEFSLAKTLTEMGMPDAFDPDRADFSGMDGTDLLLISDVFHKAFVAVDEAGTEAAAASAVVMTLESMPVSDVSLVVDRPFIFLIRDVPTGTLLFVGRVLDPAG